MCVNLLSRSCRTQCAYSALAHSPYSCVVHCSTPPFQVVLADTTSLFTCTSTSRRHWFGQHLANIGAEARCIGNRQRRNCFDEGWGDHIAQVCHRETRIDGSNSHGADLDRRKESELAEE